MAWNQTGAEVLVNDSYSTSLAASYEVSRYVCKVYATTHTIVKEYRGITKAKAQELAAANNSCNKTAFRTWYDSATDTTTQSPATEPATHTHFAVVPALIGTEKNAQARRANEAGGYTVTVTENITTATSSWVLGTSASA